MFILCQLKKRGEVSVLQIHFYVVCSHFTINNALYVYISDIQTTHLEVIIFISYDIRRDIIARRHLNANDQTHVEDLNSGVMLLYGDEANGKIYTNVFKISLGPAFYISRKPKNVPIISMSLFSFLLIFHI